MPSNPQNTLETYTIYYIEDGELYKFVCQAEDSCHAIEQHKDANPNTKIIDCKRAKIEGRI